jgi:hypothetical protein
VPLQIVEGLFGGSILSLQRRLGIPGGAAHGAWREVAWAIGVGWLPLVVLVVGQSELHAALGMSAFFADRGIHCRALIAGPVLILGRAIAYPQLSRTCAHFLEAGLISTSDQPRFEAALASTRRLESSRSAVTGAIALAYAIVLALIASAPALPAWHVGRTTWLLAYSPAGWWHVLVSLPLLIVLLLGWLWRLLLWTRLLWIVSGLELALVPAHPDRAAGLKFVGYAVRAFAPVGFALGVIVAGALANSVARHALPLTTYRNIGAGLLLIVVLLFTMPLLAFVRPLTSAWQRGLHEYGSFAHGLGQGFERKWLTGAKPDQPALGLQDFSALNDLYQTVGNVYAMRVFPLDAQSVILLSAATVIPILIVAVSSLPMEVIGGFIAGLLF